MRFLSCNIVQRIRLRHVLNALKPQYNVLSRAVIVVHRNSIKRNFG